MAFWFRRVPASVFFFVTLLSLLSLPMTVRGAIDSDATDAELVMQYCAGLGRGSEEAPAANAGVLNEGGSGALLPAHLDAMDVENVWKLKGQAWGPITGFVNFGPLEWGGKTHHVIVYRDPDHPIAALRDRMIFEGYAWGENVGWINMNTAQYFCNNLTSYENFQSGSLSFRDALSLMDQVNGPLVQMWANDIKQIGNASANWGVFTTLLSQGHSYIYGSSAKLNEAAGSISPTDMVRNAVGPAALQSFGPYQISLSIVGRADGGTQSFVDTGSFTFYDNASRSNTLSLEQAVGKSPTHTDRVWVEGQAWSRQLGPLVSPQKEACSTAWNDTVTLQGITADPAATNHENAVVQGCAAQPPLQIAPLTVNVDAASQVGSTVPMVDVTKTGQFLGALWSPRLGWLYFSPVRFDENVRGLIKSGVVIQKVENDRCPLPVVSPATLYITSATQYPQLIQIPADPWKNSEGQEVMRRVTLQIASMTATSSSGSSPAMSSLYAVGTTASGASNPPLYVECRGGVTCTKASDGQLTIGGATGVLTSSAENPSSVSVVWRVNRESSMWNQISGITLRYGVTPVTPSEWPKSCITESTSGGGGGTGSCPNGSGCVTIEPNNMCALANLSMTQNSCVPNNENPSALRGTPRVDVSFYTQSSEELGTTQASQVKVKLELFDITTNANAPVVSVDDLFLRLSQNPTPPGGTPRSFAFNSKMTLPIWWITHRYSGYTLKPGNAYRVKLTTTVTPGSGAPSNSSSEVHFLTQMCTNVDATSAIPPTANMSNFAPIIPVEVKREYVGFEQGVTATNEEKSVYQTKIYIKPHVVPLPRHFDRRRDAGFAQQYTEGSCTECDKDGDCNTINYDDHTPLEQVLKDPGDLAHFSRPTSIQYVLYRAEVSAQGFVGTPISLGVKHTMSLNGNDPSTLKIVKPLEEAVRVEYPNRSNSGRASSMLAQNLMAGHQYKYGANGQWTSIPSNQSPVGLFSPGGSSQDRRLLFTDTELEDGKNYVYFVEAKMQYVMYGEKGYYRPIPFYEQGCPSERWEWVFEGYSQSNGTSKDRGITSRSGASVSDIIKGFNSESLWVSSYSDPLPRSLVGVSDIVETPKQPDPLSVQITTAASKVSGTGAGASSTPCYPTDNSAECTAQRITYASFRDAVSQGNGVPVATPDPNGSDIAASCTNQTNGQITSDKCSTGGYVMAGAPVEITMFGFQDNQCTVLNDTSTELPYDNNQTQTPNSTFQVQLDPNAVSRMFYWGGTSNPDFDMESCGSQFGVHGPSCTGIPVQLSLAPDRLVTRSCAVGEAENPSCVNLEYTGTLANTYSSGYQPIKVYVLGYDVLRTLGGQAAGKYAPIYTGRWSLELNGLRFGYGANVLRVSDQRTFFVVKPSVPVFTPLEMATGQPKDSIIRHDEQDYSKFGLSQLDAGWKNLSSAQRFPFALALQGLSGMIPSELSELFTANVAGYKPIADGHSGYGLLLDLRDRFGNRLPVEEHSYALGGGAIAARDTLAVNAYITSDQNGLATEQVTINNNNHSSESTTSTLEKPASVNFSALQIVSLADVAKRNRFGLNPITTNALEYINNGSGDVAYMTPLYTGKLVSVAPTLDNYQGSFDRIRLTKDGESPTLGLSRFEMTEATGLSTESIAVGSGNNNILDAEGSTTCGTTGADCFKPTITYLRNSGGVSITLPQITKFGAQQNPTLKQDVKFFPALEIGCSFFENTQGDDPTAATGCGLYYLDPIVKSSGAFGNNESKYAPNKSQFQLTNRKTERFLAVLRPNLTGGQRIEDIELKLHIETGNSAQIEVENIYVEKICKRNEPNCNIYSDQDAVQVDYQPGQAVMNIGGTEFSKANYQVTGNSPNGLARKVLTLVSDGWTLGSPVDSVLYDLENLSKDPGAIFKLFSGNSSFKNQSGSATPYLGADDVVLVRFVGTPVIVTGTTNVSSVTPNAKITSSLLYRVGAPGEIAGGALNTTNGTYPMTAHYGQTFRGSSVLPTNTTNTCSIDIRGRVRSGIFNPIVSQQTSTDLEVLGGGIDSYLNEMKRVIDRNLAEIMRTNVTDPISNGASLIVGRTATDYVFNVEDFVSEAALMGQNDVIYVNNRDVVLGQAGGVIRFRDDRPVTFVIDGGNLIVKANMIYEGQNPQVGFIVRQQQQSASSGNVRGGNIFIDPEVVNMRGVFYAEGSMMTAEDGWTEDCSASNSENGQIEDCEIFDGFSSENPKLRNQLYIRGAVVSLNTIGGSDKASPDLPLTKVASMYRVADLLRLWAPVQVSGQERQENVSLADVQPEYNDFTSASSMTELFRKQWSQRYDFNYLRLCGIDQESGWGTFNNILGFAQGQVRVWNDGSKQWGAPKADLIVPQINPNNEYPSVVFEYDPSIQTNIPPGFVVPGSVRLEERR